MNMKSISKNPKKINKLVKIKLDIDSKSAQDAKTIGYYSKIFLKATLPHSKPKEHYFQRTNGNVTMTMIGNPTYGLPYGSLVRVLLAWIIREVKLKKSHILNLGRLSEFLATLNLSRSGGERGDITRLRDQMLRLFSTQISFSYVDNKLGRTRADQFLITQSFDIWWNPLSIQTTDNWNKSVITLSQNFYKELIENSVPIDTRMLEALRSSPLQIDIYTWLTFKFSNLKKPSKISWKALVCQFGSNSHYESTSQGLRDFKREFLKGLDIVKAMYCEANVEILDIGIRLLPSQTHIKKCKNNKILHLSTEKMISTDLVDLQSYPR